MEVGQRRRDLRSHVAPLQHGKVPLVLVARAEGSQERASVAKLEQQQHGLPRLLHAQQPDNVGVGKPRLDARLQQQTQDLRLVRAQTAAARLLHSDRNGALPAAVAMQDAARDAAVVPLPEDGAREHNLLWPDANVRVLKGGRARPQLGILVLKRGVRLRREG